MYLPAGVVADVIVVLVVVLVVIIDVVGIVVVVLVAVIGVVVGSDVIVAWPRSAQFVENDNLLIDYPKKLVINSILEMSCS